MNTKTGQKNNNIQQKNDKIIPKKAKKQEQSFFESLYLDFLEV